MNTCIYKCRHLISLRREPRAILLGLALLQLIWRVFFVHEFGCVFNFWDTPLWKSCPLLIAACLLCLNTRWSSGLAFVISAHEFYWLGGLVSGLFTVFWLPVGTVFTHAEMWERLTGWWIFMLAESPFDVTQFIIAGLISTYSIVAFTRSTVRTHSVMR